MATCGLFEDDVVCHVTRDHGFVYGLLLENSETASSDDDDSISDTCKRGCVRIAWHPRGKESHNTPENKVLLVDRSLMVSDVVRKFVLGQETQCGLVQDLQVKCHLHIKGTDKYIYNVDSKMLTPISSMQRYENGFVTMDNWLGRVEEVVEILTLLMPDGARCEIDDTEAAYFDDMTEKQPESAAFCEEYWYRGQKLKGEMTNLAKATWLNSTNIFNAKNAQNKKNAFFLCVVESVRISCIYVMWICSGYPKATMNFSSENGMPPLKIVGNDINRLQIVDSFEHCYAKLGDKMFYTIQEGDVLETQTPKHHFVPLAAQRCTPEQLAEITHRTEDLLKQCFEGANRKRRRGSKRGSMPRTSGSNATTNMVASSISAGNQPDGAAAAGAVSSENSAAQTEKASEPSHTPANENGGGDVEGEADVDTDDDFEEADERDFSDSDDGSLSSSVSGPKRRRRDRGIAVSIRSLHDAILQARRAQPTLEIYLTPGSRVPTEICYTFRLVTVQWQDGTLERNIPSVELFPMHHLDELEYFPGTYIVDNSATTGSEYGVVTSSNRFERTCQVKWFQPYEVGVTTCPAEVIKDSEVSVYDIQEHEDYKFRPGNSVIRVSGFEDTEQTLQAVGQVVRLDPSGTVYIRWSDGTYGSSYPQELYVVWDMTEYSDSSSDLESSNSDDFESTQTISNCSWETEEEEDLEPDEEVGDEGDGDVEESQMTASVGGTTGSVRRTVKRPPFLSCTFDESTGILRLAFRGEEEFNELEEEEQLKFKDMGEQWTTEIVRLMNTITHCFEMVGEKYMALAIRWPDNFHCLVTENSAMTPCLKKLVKAYRDWHRIEREIKTGLGCCDLGPIQSLIVSMKYDIKLERSNRIKQHLAHVFVNSNRGLLNQSKEKSEAESDITAQCNGSGSGTEEGAHDDDMEKTENRSHGKTEVAVASVDIRSDSPSDVVCSLEENSGLQRVQDVENDISHRLAATDVDGEVNVHNDNKRSALAENGDDGDKTPTVVDLAVSADDSSYMRMLLETANSSLTTIQESLNELNRIKKSAQRKSEDKPETQHSLEDPQMKSSVEEGKQEYLPAVDKSQQDTEVHMSGLAGMEIAVADKRVTCVNVLSAGATMDKSYKMMDETGCETEVEKDVVNPPGVVLPKGFFLCGTVPSNHSYASKASMPANSKFFAAVRKELRLLRSSLPEGIIVKGFENRLDLFSVLIDGPADTPYEDGIFLFDVMLPYDYPASPPLFHYRSYATDRLNPNLYVDGKVCVSLLGTWSGKGMEIWTEQSNLLQVLVSIQGLILVDEPYYNEAGYERQRGHQIACENSRMYNEMALLKLVESMTTLCYDTPKPFEEEVVERLKTNGARMIARLRMWMAMSENMVQCSGQATADSNKKSAEDEAQTTSDPMAGAQTTTDPVDGAQITPEPVTGAQTNTEPMDGAQITTKPMTGAQTTTEPMSRTQTTTEPMTRAQTTTKPMTGPQTITEPMTGAQTTTEPMTGAQTTTEPMTGAQTTTKPMTGPQTITEPMTGAQTSTEPMDGAQPTEAKDDPTAEHTKEDGPASDGTTSSGVAPTGESALLTDQASAKGNQDQASKRKRRPGHPSFPLLPMSRGFRLTLQKSLIKMEKAIHGLLHLVGLQQAMADGGEMPGEPSAAPS